MSEHSDKYVLILNDSNWCKWSAIMKLRFKMIKAWSMMENDKTAEDYKEGDERDKYRELALKVNLLLMQGTEGDDNEIVAAQDSENISAAWRKLVEKHEGNQDEILLKTFDDLALETFTELKDANIYVERYLHWATVIKNKAGSIENLTKLVITTNMFRSLPKEFETVKERIRADLEEYDLQKIGDAIKGRAREVLKDKQYEKQFKSREQPDSDDEEIARLNAEMNYIGFENENWSDGDDGWPNPEDEWSGYSDKAAVKFKRDRPSADRQWFGRGRTRNQAERERIQEPEKAKYAGYNLNAIIQSNSKPMKILGHMNAIISHQIERKAGEPRSQKPRRIVGAMSAIMQETVESNRRASTENLRSGMGRIRSAARAPEMKAKKYEKNSGNQRPANSSEQMDKRGKSKSQRRIRRRRWMDTNWRQSSAGQDERTGDLTKEMKIDLLKRMRNKLLKTVLSVDTMLGKLAKVSGTPGSTPQLVRSRM